MAKKKRKREVKRIEGIPLKAFEDMTIGQIKKLDKDFKVPNVKLVKSYGKETKL